MEGPPVRRRQDAHGAVLVSAEKVGSIGDHLPGKLVRMLFTDNEHGEYRVVDVLFGWAYCELYVSGADCEGTCWVNLAEVSCIFILKDEPKK